MKRARIFLLLLVLGLPLYLFSAETAAKGDIKGRVSDEEGKPLAEVRVEVLDAGIVTVSDKQGYFRLEELVVGKYRLIFSHPDYMPGMLEILVTEKPGALIEGRLSPVNPTLLTIREEITVTAEADSLIDVSLPSHRNILTDKALDQLGTANLAESVRTIPGVDMVGKGGYSMAPSIRGLAENRILLLLDGVRITSERRIGASASFVSLNDIDRIEISRGPYSVFHGSGAIGGVINMLTRNPAPGAPWSGEVTAGYNTVREERSGSLNLSGSAGKYGFLFAANGKAAEAYDSPRGTVLGSEYSDTNLLFKLNRTGEDSQFSLTFLDYYGKDIGKPSPSSLYKPRWYPRERNTFLSFNGGWRNRFYLDSLNFNFYVLLPVLETEKENLREDFSVKKRALARIDGTNFGFNVRGAKKLGGRHFLNFGMDFFGRRNIDDSNTEWSLDTAGSVTSMVSEVSLVDAARSSLGFFLDDNVRIGTCLTLKGGARFDVIGTGNSRAAGGRLTRNDQAVTAYLGGILQFDSHLSLIANLGRSFRFPTVSELFYSGLTGRGTVFGNPDLDPESGINLDLGLRYLHSCFYASVYAFRNHVSNMIQKYQGDAEEEYFFRNLTSGRIQGIEGDFYLWPGRDLEFRINFHLMDGQDPKTGAPLNYIPPSRIALTGKWAPGRFWLEPKLTLSSGVDEPGPLEIAIDGYALLDAAAGVDVSRHWRVTCIGRNLTDSLFRFSADESGVVAPGRGFIFRAQYRF